MKPFKYILTFVLALAAVLFYGAAHAAVCAKVKIEIPQELALERLAFDGRLIITNNLPDVPLDGVNVSLYIKDANGDDAGALFFTKIQSMTNISAVDGTGTIPAGGQAEVHWLFIPSPGAGGQAPQGVYYFIGGEITFTANGADQVIPMMPDRITVKPQPELIVDYFLPREVWADDPFTATVEAPKPFSLGARVRNFGFGPGYNLTITSGQPRIVENKQGLLIDFRILGSSVNDQPVAPTLTLNFGNIDSKRCATGRWRMVTTLSGRFTEFTASFTHASELGGTLTSLLKEVKTHFLTHEMMVDLPGSDNVLDYLSYDDQLGDRSPTMIYASECVEYAVNTVASSSAGSPTPADPTTIITTDVLPAWTYSKVIDPASGNLPIRSVTRSDGKALNANNAWISEIKPNSLQQEPSVFYLNIIDFDTTGSYTVVYETPAVDVTPPVTAIVIGDVKYGADPVYVTSQTNFLFTAADDISGVQSMLYDIDGTGFVPGLPFTLQYAIPPDRTHAGPHTITYYSVDRAGNAETPKGVSVFVDDDAPSVSSYGILPKTITPGASIASGLARSATATALVADAMPSLDAVYDVYPGAFGPADVNLPAKVASLTGALAPGAAADIAWDGKSSGGYLVPPGEYTIRLTVIDKLGHSAASFATVTVSDVIQANPLSAGAGDQRYPSISGPRAVWQDFRDNKWDVYMHDFTDGTTTNLTAGTLADQIRPNVNGNYVVWQDRTAGNWDVVLYDMLSGSRTVITSSAYDDAMPAVNGRYVAYQSGPATNRDIYVYVIATGQTLRLTTGVRDQINPALYLNKVVWEDYRNGLGDIYMYDIGTGAEKNLTNDIYNQTRPSIADGKAVWVDQRDGNRELYSYRLSNGAVERLTSTLTDETGPKAASGYAVYTDYDAGWADSGLSLMHMPSRQVTKLVTEPHSQEEPAISGRRLVWQDNRSGTWQIYSAELAMKENVRVEQGLNVMAVTRPTADAYANAFGLLDAWKPSAAVNSIYSFDGPSGQMLGAGYDGLGASAGNNFTLTENTAVYLYADKAADLDGGAITGLGCGGLNLKAGFNLVTYPCSHEHFIYTASDLVRSLGAGRILSISRFDAVAGKMLTLAVANGATVGDDFAIEPGEGYIIYATEGILNWAP
ncbi:MAG: hypothetical protein HY894_06145 [Deltaproteobacteria bacterium]|nr:hypothetical protein [Deltaproteobacteria bacterium]